MLAHISVKPFYFMRLVAIVFALIFVYRDSLAGERELCSTFPQHPAVASKEVGLIKYAKTSGGWGRFPAYKVWLYDNGQMRFYGRSKTSILGERCLQVETELYEKIASKIRSLSEMISEEKQCAQHIFHDAPYTFISLQTKTENINVTLGNNFGCLFRKKVEGLEKCCTLIEQIRGLLPIDEFVRGH